MKDTLVDTDQRPVRPFRIGTTSFIYPDHILPNLQKLGRFFDEIELLVFESRPDHVVPSEHQVAEFSAVAQALDFTCNVHLPTDISLCHPSAEARQEAADTYMRVIERFEPLEPATHTLHLELPVISPMEKPLDDVVKHWRDNARQGLRSLFSTGLDPKCLTLETLDYPFSVMAPLVDEFDLPVCLDVGHAIKYGYDPLTILKTRDIKIPLVHLHGVAMSPQERNDHTRLDRLPQNVLQAVFTLLETYTGTVSLEVFHLDSLNHSLAALATHFSGIPEPIC